MRGLDVMKEVSHIHTLKLIWTLKKHRIFSSSLLSTIISKLTCVSTDLPSRSSDTLPMCYLLFSTLFTPGLGWPGAECAAASQNIRACAGTAAVHPRWISSRGVVRVERRRQTWRPAECARSAMRQFKTGSKWICYFSIENGPVRSIGDVSNPVKCFVGLA